jgi:protein TonB
LRAPAPPQTASPPPPAAAPAVSAGYRGALARWFATHKSYPESARNRGEEGEAVLRFRVDRGGRVLGYSLVKGTGYPDLDAAVEAMMRGAVLPPFPADMAANDIEVSVPVRFSLTR